MESTSVYWKPIVNLLEAEDRRDYRKMNTRACFMFRAGCRGYSPALIVVNRIINDAYFLVKSGEEPLLNRGSSLFFIFSLK